MEKYNENINLAKWLEGSLSEEQAKVLGNKEDLDELAKVLDATDNMSTTQLDSEKLWERLQEQIAPPQAKTKIRALRPLAWAGAAAAVIGLFIISYFGFQNQDIRKFSSVGEHTVLTLPDDSEIFLNAVSEVYYNKQDWNDSRTVSLEGEAFFKVEKGKTFRVKTDLGEVTVLGTTFNVLSRGDYMEVKCYTGKVQVKGDGNQTRILNAGEGLHFTPDSAFKDSKLIAAQPTWVDGESSYIAAPLNRVLAEIQRQYKVSFDMKRVDSVFLEKGFTGSFRHNDLELALKEVLDPMSIQYKRIDQRSYELHSD